MLSKIIATSLLPLLKPTWSWASLFPLNLGLSSLLLTLKILFLFNNCVSTRFGLRQPCFNLEKHNWCWATLFPPDLDFSNLVSSWKSTIYDEQPCFHLIWPWATLFHIRKAQMIEQPCFNLIWTWVILFHLGKAKLILSNLVSTWFGLEQPCFIFQ